MHLVPWAEPAVNAVVPEDAVAKVRIRPGRKPGLRVPFSHLPPLRQFICSGKIAVIREANSRGVDVRKPRRPAPTLANCGINIVAVPLDDFTQSPLSAPMHLERCTRSHLHRFRQHDDLSYTGLFGKLFITRSKPSEQPRYRCMRGIQNRIDWKLAPATLKPYNRGLNHRKRNFIRKALERFLLLPRLTDVKRTRKWLTTSPRSHEQSA